MGHYYAQDGSPAYFINGRDTTLRDARKLKLVPSTTEVLAIIAKPQLVRWQVNQGILAALTLPRQDGWTEEKYLDAIAEDGKRQAQEAADRGSYIHDQLERDRNGQSVDDWCKPTCERVRELLSDSFPDVHDWVAEKSFAHQSGYGGRVDLHSPSTGIVADYKGLSLDTPLPTPDGWTTMGKVCVGDELIGSDGKPCVVTAKSKVKHIGTYEVTFDDGQCVVCDSEHIWWLRDGGFGSPHTVLRPIDEMVGRVRIEGELQFHVPVASPIVLPDADVSVNPYILGAWLGDGRSADAMITIGDKDADAMIGLIEAAGTSVGKKYQNGNAATYYLGKKGRLRSKTSKTFVANGSLASRLRQLGVINNKHIPKAYLRGSIEQRLALVQGLMDTDGTWNKPRKRAVYITTSDALAEGMFELLVSLGQKPHVDWRTVTGFGVQCRRCAIEWTPVGMNPFRLPRKRMLVKLGPQQGIKSTTRTIVSIKAGKNIPTACVAVDSKNQTYLCGMAMIPTHNTKDGDFSDGKQLAYDQYYQLASYQQGLELPRNVVAAVFVSRDTPGAAQIHVWPVEKVDEGKAVFNAALALWKVLHNYDGSFEYE